MTTTQSPAANPVSLPRGLRTAIVVCFFLSGFAALLYQVAWLRQFSFVFGTSELAVVTVLVAFLAGLSGGAALAARYVVRVARPIWIYGLLEAGIAVAALSVPVLLMLIRAVYAWTLGDQPAPPSAAAWGQPLFYVIVALVVLALPTALMGATLPLLTRATVHGDQQIGPRVGMLYGINTLGAVCGALAAGFVLLPAIGLNRTVLTGVAINAAIFGLIVALARKHETPLPVASAGAERPFEGEMPSSTGFYGACIRPLLSRAAARPGQARRALTSRPEWILPIMLGSGAIALVYEVLWTRLLTHVLGGSIYAFATMLAAFLGGIALGSWAAGSIARERGLAANAFVAVQIAIAVLSILI